jgi:hypothetical protein
MKSSCLEIMALLAFAPAIAAQGASHQFSLPRRAVAAHTHRLGSEIAVQGTIQSVIRKPTSGLMLGGHLMVVTPQGTVDVQIGRFLLRGDDKVSFTAGEPMRAIGMMSTFHGRAVFLARLVQTPGGIIEVRNRQGVQISPIARKALARQASNAGGAQ